MIEPLKTAWRNLVTGKDNETHDLGRFSWIGSHLAVTGAAVFNALHGNAINLMELAGAHGAVAGAHGASIFMKRHTEPDAEPPPA